MPEFNVITPTSLKQKPTTLEYIVADVIAKFFSSNVHFVEPSILRAPDLYVAKSRRTWEIKNIKGNSKRTIANNLRSAQYQSPNIIISLLATKMTPTQAKNRIIEFLNSGPSKIQKVLIVTKNKKVLVIK